MKAIWWISFIFDLMVDIGQKFLSAPTLPQGDNHGVKVTDFEFS